MFVTFRSPLLASNLQSPFCKGSYFLQFLLWRGKTTTKKRTNSYFTSAISVNLCTSLPFMSNVGLMWHTSAQSSGMRTKEQG